MNERALKILCALYASRYMHFFAVGVTGVALNLAVTVTLTELLFSREQYFTAYIIGLGVNLLYNFVLHTVITFKTSRHHMFRLVGFMAYSISMAYAQTHVVRYITSLVGVNWYALVIGSVILTFSVVTFVLFKLVLFKEEKSRPES